MEELLIKLLTSTARLPERGSPGSVGYDCFADLPERGASGVLIPPRLRKVIPLGFAMKPPSGTYGRLAPRSGLAVKEGLDVMAGVIDADYTGGVGVVLFNSGDQPVRIIHGMKVCQLILEQAKIAEVREVLQLDTTNRGSGGFGSTGI